MGSHSVTCHPTQVNTPRPNPSQIGWYAVYLPRRDRRLSWPGDGDIPRWFYPPIQLIRYTNRACRARPGIELATCGSQVLRPNITKPTIDTYMYMSLGAEILRGEMWEWWSLPNTKKLYSVLYFSHVNFLSHHYNVVRQEIHMWKIWYAGFWLFSMSDVIVIVTSACTGLFSM